MADNQTYNRIKWLLIDGVPFQFLLEYCDKEGTPNLFRLLNLYSFLELEPGYPNCQTPPSLFSIWSGEGNHGIYGFDAPKPTQASCLAYENSFKNWPKKYTLIWEKFSEKGKGIRLDFVPFVTREYAQRHILMHRRIYDRLIYSSNVFDIENGEIQIDVIGVSITIEHLSESNSILRITHQNCTEESIVSHDNFFSINVTEDIILTGMITQRSETPIFCLLGRYEYTALGLRCSENGDDVFYGTCLSKEYRNGKLGLKLCEGGNGKAEEILLESLKLVHNSFVSKITHSCKQDDAFLYIGYYPVIDLAFHELLRLNFVSFTDEASITAKKNIFSIIIGWIEEVVSIISSSLEEDDRLIINSDHGMQVYHYSFYINSFFEKYSWVSFDEHKKIDWGNSHFVFHPAQNGSIFVNLNKNGVAIEDAIQEIRNFLDSNGLVSDIKLIEISRNNNFIHYFIFFPDGIELRATKNNQYLTKSLKSAGHNYYSDDPWLRGFLLCNRNVPHSLKQIRLDQIIELCT